MKLRINQIESTMNITLDSRKKETNIELKKTKILFEI